MVSREKKPLHLLSIKPPFSFVLHFAETKKKIDKESHENSNGFSMRKKRQRQRQQYEAHGTEARKATNTVRVYEPGTSTSPSVQLATWYIVLHTLIYRFQTLMLQQCKHRHTDMSECAISHV